MQPNWVSDVITQVSDSSSEHSDDVTAAAQEKLQEVLHEMHENTDGIVASVVSSVDGVAWSSILNDDQDQHRFAAMSSTLLALGDTFIQEAKRGETRNVLVESDAGNIYAMHAGDNLVLTIITSKNSNLGMTIARARMAAEKISHLTI